MLCENSNGKKLQAQNKREPTMSVRTSSRKRLKTGSVVDIVSYKKCEKGGCFAKKPICFAEAYSKCAKDSGHTSRWYHISAGEHFCNDCFDFYYRPNKEGYPIYLDWRKKWIENSRTEPAVKVFLNDEILPYWIQCTNVKCRKWRNVSNAALNGSYVGKEFLRRFECCLSYHSNATRMNRCEDIEDERIAEITEQKWINQLTLPALLKMSPAAPFLVNYFPDGIGLSPTCESSTKPAVMKSNSTASKSASLLMPLTQNPSVLGLNPNFEPFYQPMEHGKSFCIRPDVMDPDEINAFPEYHKEQVMYLGVRNLIIALWNLNCKKWLTCEEVMHHLICRGLARVRCAYEATKILKFLTTNSVINIGIISLPQEEKFLSSCKESILVIGAGASGLAAACQLSNFGFKVTVLESHNRIGGRVWDDRSLGKCIGKGAQIVTGIINNPISYMCHQTDLPMKTVGINCDLYNSKGEIISPSMDSKLEMHFNAMLEYVSNWRKNQTEDANLMSKLNQMNDELLNLENGQLNDAESNVLQFHISNLEYACGTNLGNVSSIHWDQNESFPQFAGSHAILPNGYSSLLDKLAVGLDIKLNSKVIKVDYSGDLIQVELDSGASFQANKVVVSLPLAVLKSNSVEFCPTLPQRKLDSISKIGAGVIEKVILKFDCCFWREKICDLDYFGHVPNKDSSRGVFAIFYDLSFCQSTDVSEDKFYYLMTYLSGDAVNLTLNKSDSEITELCMEKLRGIFDGNSSDKTLVPDPVGSLVTHWKTDPHAGMSYSYMKVGSSGEDYNIMAESVADKLFFAGEATNRQFPQTVSGAYLSGTREAGKIFNLFSP